MSSFCVDSASSISSISVEMEKPTDAKSPQRVKLKTNFKKFIRSILILLKAFKIKPKYHASLSFYFLTFIFDLK